jgi:hypothetical protein
MDGISGAKSVENQMWGIRTAQDAQMLNRAQENTEAEAQIRRELLFSMSSPKRGQACSRSSSNVEGARGNG